MRGKAGLAIVMVISLLVGVGGAQPRQPRQACPIPTPAVEPPAVFVPQDLAILDPCRVVFNEHRHPYVRDQLVVGLKLGLPDPDSVILALAQRHGARVEGSISGAAMYELQFPDVPGLEALQALSERLEAEPEVAFASISYLMRLYSN